MITQEQFNILTEINDKVLTKEEEYNVFEFYDSHKTIENRNKIAEKNYRLVFKPAREYTRFNAEFDDLSQEAFLGLLQAIDKFDYTMGNRFSTYAYEWFKSYLQKCTLDNNLIHLPFNLAWRIEKMKRIIREYADKHGNEPNDIYVMKKLGVDSIELNLLKQYDLRIFSMDYEYGSSEDDSLTFHNCLIDEKYNTEKIIDQIAANFAINDVIKKYISRDQYELLSRRYGLNGNRPCTLEELSQVYGINETRLNMKLKSIMRKIRSNPKIKAKLKGII